MEKKTENIKRVLVGLAFAIIALPMIQHTSQLFKFSDLSGAVEEVPKPVFSPKGWFDGEYAKEYDKYITHNFGIRPSLVRLDNQIAYSLFGEVRARNVVVGKENYLYESNYIDAYTGRDFVGYSTIAEKVRKLRVIQDSLHARGKHLLVILAAGKASFFPEYIPDDMMQDAGDSTNYKVFAKELAVQGVRHIDFNAWFMDMKGRAGYPLYPKTGIHWSLYGMTLAADSIAKHVEELAGWDLPEIRVDGIDYVDECRGADDDIEKAMNLYASFPKYKLAYPKISFVKKGKDRPRSIMISDSYYWAMYSMGMSSEVFGEGQFWYYYSQVYPASFDVSTLVEDLDINAEISAADIVMVMGTEGNYKYFPWKAEDSLLEYLEDGEKFEARRKEAEILDMMERIRSDPKWLDAVSLKASEKGVPLDSMLRRDAIYMLEQQGDE